MVKDLIKIFLLFFLRLSQKKILVFGDRMEKGLLTIRVTYLYLNEFRKDYKCIWISSNQKIIKLLRQKNYICYEPNLLKAYTILRAKLNLYNFVENDIQIFD